MGQFATPSALASEILAYAKKLMPCGQKIRFLDPGLGTGAFYSALLQAFPTTELPQRLAMKSTPTMATLLFNFGQTAA